MSSSYSTRRRVRQVRRTAGRRSGGGDDRGLVCLVVCGIAFVLLVAVKLLFPETAARLADSARQIISQDADFEEAFAAVGRMVSGETPAGDALQDAYTAVFNPSPQPEAGLEPPAEPAPEVQAQDFSPLPSAPEDAGAAPDQSLLRYSVLDLPEADRMVMTELVLSPDSGGLDPASLPASGPAADPGDQAVEPDGGEGSDAEPASSSSASYLYTMPALPENASLEQRNLGFSHCTPVPGKLTSSFGWREHPIEGGNKFHYGVDLAAAEGTDILAFADGEVYASGESSGLGNYIMLRHEGGYITLYAHCSRVTASGGAVSQGDKIAEVGSTGLATGPHLHFELHDGDLRLNPIYYVEVG